MTLNEINKATRHLFTQTLLNEMSTRKAVVGLPVGTRDVPDQRVLQTFMSDDDVELTKKRQEGRSKVQMLSQADRALSSSTSDAIEGKARIPVL